MLKDVSKATFQIWRGDAETGAFKDYSTEVGEGMVVLDAVHNIQAESAPDLACRWNCKAGKSQLGRGNGSSRAPSGLSVTAQSNTQGDSPPLRGCACPGLPSHAPSELSPPSTNHAREKLDPHRDF